MKKIVLYLCAGILVLGLTACGKNGQGESGSQGSGQGGDVSSTPEAGGDGAGDGQDSGEETGGADSGSSDAGNPDAAGEGQSPGEGDGSEDGNLQEVGTAGWSEEMEGLKQAVAAALGEDNYWPDMAMDADMMEVFFGLTSEMYEDFMAESPMISGNVDTLVIVKAKEGQADAVEEALNNYRDANINDTMQYPQNLGKIQASQVERMGNYVIFVQLGGYAIDAEEEAEVISQCREANQLALDTIRGIVEEN